MKKIAITLFFTGLLLFCVYGAISYSSVRVDNPASLEIVNPDSNSLFATNSASNGLISINASGDYYSIEQGLAEGFLLSQTSWNQVLILRLNVIVIILPLLMIMDTVILTHMVSAIYP